MLSQENWSEDVGSLQQHTESSGRSPMDATPCQGGRDDSSSLPITVSFSLSLAGEVGRMRDIQCFQSCLLFASLSHSGLWIGSIQLASQFFEVEEHNQNSGLEEALMASAVH